MKKSQICTALAVIATAAFVSACKPASETSAVGSAAPDQSRSSGQSSSVTTETTSRDTTSREVTTPDSRPADNTGKNVRDRADGALTPEDQGGSEADREMTRQIRRAITSADQASMNAKNIKIITRDGTVTLRGPVQNDQERQTIAATAQKIPGVHAVDNQLEVKSQNQ
jgi:hyperosmotically inducible periplasmic protein